MAGDNKAHVRVNALVALESHSVSDLHEQILALMLRDRSARVRSLAAGKVMAFGLRSLLPELEEAIIREAKSTTRKTLEWERDLLRDGFRIEDRGNGSAWVTCQRGAGVISMFFPIDEVETKGRQWMA